MNLFTQKQKEVFQVSFSVLTLAAGVVAVVLFIDWNIRLQIKSAIREEFPTKPSDVYGLSMDVRQTGEDTNKVVKEILEIIKERE